MAEKKKKEKTEIKLPKAWQSVKHRNEMAQGRETYNDLWKAIGILLAVGVLLFVLMGGINQRKAVEWFMEFGRRIGDTVDSWFNPDDIVVNDDGIYYKPGSGGSDGDTSSDNGGGDTASTTVADTNTDTATEEVAGKE